MKLFYLKLIFQELDSFKLTKPYDKYFVSSTRKITVHLENGDLPLPNRKIGIICKKAEVEINTVEYTCESVKKSSDILVCECLELESGVAYEVTLANYKPNSNSVQAKFLNLEMHFTSKTIFEDF